MYCWCDQLKNKLFEGFCFLFFVLVRQGVAFIFGCLNCKCIINSKQRERDRERDRERGRERGRERKN